VTLLILLPVLLVFMGLGGWYGYRKLIADTSGSSSGSSASPTVGPSASASPSRTGALPAGWTTHRDELGFSIGLPPGWEPYDRQPTRVRFGVPGSSTYLMVDLTTWTDTDQDPMLHMQQLEQDPNIKTSFPGYRLVGLHSRTYRGRPAADWEFTWQARSGEVHVLDRAFSTADGRDFAIYWQTPAAQWSKRLSYFKSFTAAFRVS
jgi:hypothetical protein